MDYNIVVISKKNSIFPHLELSLLIASFQMIMKD